MRRKLAAGNWKMNGTSAALAELHALSTACMPSDCDVLICPPATLLSRASEAAKASPIMIGAQDCHSAEAGAFTGDLSAQMLKDAGATHVIVGHSERRDLHREQNETVRAKARAVMAEEMTAIICIGESLAAREAENTLDIIAGQVAGSVPDPANGDSLVLAYEPVWAIGTGLVPTLAQIEEVHNFLRARLARRFGEATAQAVRR